MYKAFKFFIPGNKITFTITTPPKLIILLPQNKAYNEPNVTIVFTSDKLLDYAWYSFNDQLNGTANNSSTITGLSNGTYSIVVYANDTFGNNVASETVYFTVELLAVPEPEPFPTALILAVSVAIVAVVGAGLLVYLKKHKCEAIKARAKA